MSAKVKWYAVAYPSERLHTINDAVRREECRTERAAFERIEEWRKERPGLRFVVRREIESPVREEKPKP